ncbi:MAG: segregation/condensation protein A [Candidatus Diapherotrites archaeon]|uniref:Segregation/condensation protein A n=1 Tax=Candidatus Iainarchaeum sp. TaxID=3101447 RepID=A0A8T3YIW1_9ARCH|nr:segregation/condensation protein A [Candidatus Diapherotrites archaeon]
MKAIEEDDMELLQSGESAADSMVALPDKVDLVDLIEQPAWKTILIELVKTERMDPWEIDIADLASKYLKKINALTGNDLRLPANAILASAILLKFKANVLRISEIEDEEEFLEKQKQMSVEERAEFEAMLPDLKNIRKIKEGKVSLDELVLSIEKMLNSAKKTKDRNILRERTKFIIPAHDFDIDKAMEKVYKSITKAADSQGLVLFSRLVKESDTNEGIVRTFIPCLFLTNKGRINMWQDVFFGEIFLSLNAGNQAEKS